MAAFQSIKSKCSGLGRSLAPTRLCFEMPPLSWPPKGRRLWLSQWCYYTCGVILFHPGPSDKTNKKLDGQKSMPTSQISTGISSGLVGTPPLLHGISSGLVGTAPLPHGISSGLVGSAPLLHGMSSGLVGTACSPLSANALQPEGGAPQMGTLGEARGGQGQGWQGRACPPR